MNGCHPVGSRRGAVDVQWTCTGRTGHPGSHLPAATSSLRAFVRVPEHIPQLLVSGAIAGTGTPTQRCQGTSTLPWGYDGEGSA